MEDAVSGVFFNEILSHINEYVYSVTLENNRILSVYHSPRSQVLLGYSPEELSMDFTLWKSLIYPEDRETVIGFLTYARQRSSTSAIEHRIVHRSGAVRWVTNSCNIVVDAKTKTERLDGVVSDITERKKRVLQLTRLNRVVEQSPSAVVVTGVTGEIEYVNPKCCQITGYNVDELVGQNPRILKSGDKSVEFYRELWNTISSGGEWKGEFKNRAKDGRIFYEMASISPLRDEGGEIVNYIGVKEDITERKLAEIELTKREKELRKRNDKYVFELEQAQRLHRALMPKESPENEFISSVFLYRPMDEVGGDYFSFSEHMDGSTGLIVADVSGHGVSAALYLTLIKHISEKIVNRLWNMPDRVLEDINNELVSTMELNFVTLLYGCFTYYPESSCVSFHYANGGHTNSIVYFKNENQYELFNAKGTILGMFKEYQVESETLTLHSGDRLFFFTDGLIELWDSSKKMLGYDGLTEILKRNSDNSITALKKKIETEINLFCGGKPADDDILLVIIEIK
ncbi:MAG: PAS domain S-box protein [Spirochaetes bacterium]|nr:PAS domain S-box protein [Spirochaetota bacterium]MBN2771944.1 PAS domain S-box protein [Spirochaetota bacterium]